MSQPTVQPVRHGVVRQRVRHRGVVAVERRGSSSASDMKPTKHVTPPRDPAPAPRQQPAVREDVGDGDRPGVEQRPQSPGPSAATTPRRGRARAGSCSVSANAPSSRIQAIRVARLPVRDQQADVAGARNAIATNGRPDGIQSMTPPASSGPSPMKTNVARDTPGGDAEPRMDDIFRLSARNRNRCQHRDRSRAAAERVRRWRRCAAAPLLLASRGNSDVS